MSFLRSACLLLGAALFAACATTGTPTPTPTPTSAPSGAPSPQPSGAPTAAPTAVPSLDPTEGDAGIVGRATVTGDERAGRDGSYEIVGVAADGTSCGISFEGDEFITTATNASAPDGQIRQMGVTIPIGDVPPSDGGQTTDITNGRASFEFVSDNLIGTLYSGEPLEDARTSITIDVIRAGTTLMFEFAGTTWDGIEISGEMACAHAVEG